MNKQRTMGIVLQYLQMGLSTGISLVYTPIMLRILGKSEYGIYNLASSIIAYLSLLSLGFGASYLRFYFLYKKDDDNDAIKRMNGLYLTVFSIMGLLALLAGLVLASNAEMFYNNTYTGEEIKVAKVLMFFLAINLAISFPASVFSSYIISQERFIFQKIINMGKTLIGPAVNIIVLYLGYGSIGMVVSTTIISITVDIINVLYCFGKLRMKISIKNPDFHLLKDIFCFSIFIAMNQLIDQINWQTDKIVLGKMCNSGTVAVYAIGSHLNSMFTNFSTAISSVFAPKVNQIVGENETNMGQQLTNLMIKVGRIQWFILAMILSGFIFFGQFFIFKWAGEGYDKSYWVALLLMVPALIPLIQNIGIEIQRAKNKHQFRSIVYACMAITNVIISIWFVSMWGEIGAALGTTISLIVANGIVMNIYYQKKLEIDIVSFWKSIFSTFPGFVIPIIFGTALLLFYNYNSLIDFCLFIVLYVLVYAVSVYHFGINKNEKSMINGFLAKLLKR